MLLCYMATFDYLCGVNRKIITYGGYFEAFLSSLDEAVQRKVKYCLLLLKSEERLGGKFVKLIRDGLYELRIEYEGNIYRVFLSLTKDVWWCFLTALRRRVKRLQVVR